MAPEVPSNSTACDSANRTGTRSAEQCLLPVILDKFHLFAFGMSGVRPESRYLAQSGGLQSRRIPGVLKMGHRDAESRDCNSY